MKSLKTVFSTIAFALSMFTIVPMPRVDWDSRNMRYAMIAFPLAGILIGLFVWIWQALAQAFDYPQALFAAVLTIIPAVLTGGIHLDGYCDTCDALGSHAQREVRLQILNDPHVGSSAVIHLCVYFLAYFGLACTLEPTPVVPAALTLVYVLERSASGFAVATFPLAKTSGLAHTFSEASAKRPVRIGTLAIFVICTALLCVLLGFWGLGLAFAAVVALGLLYIVSMRGFGGLTGDLSGWFLQLCEILCLVVLVLATW